MIDHSHSGARCRTRYHVNTVEGVLPRHSRGTICYELDNLGRRLVFVDWDNGMGGVPVFPHEIEVLAGEMAQGIKGLGQECRGELVSPAVTLLPPQSLKTAA